LFIYAHIAHSKKTTVHHLHSANDVEEIYIGKHVELIVAQWAYTETAHCITKKGKLLHTHIYSGPASSLCHKVYQKHNQANLYVNLGPHKHLYKQASYLPHSMTLPYM
jgi:hypothetical protein